MTKCKNAIGIAVVILGCVLAISCTDEKPVFANMEAYAHEDGTYRGSFIDRGLIQVNVQFILVDGVIREVTFRHLQGIEPPYHLENEEEPYKSVIQQYEEALQYLVGKPLSHHLIHFTNPGTWCKPKWTDIRVLPFDLEKLYLPFGMHFRAGSIDIPTCGRKDEDQRKRNATGNNVAHLL